MTLCPQDQAKAVCRRCPVMEKCLNSAIRADPVEGTTQWQKHCVRPRPVGRPHRNGMSHRHRLVGHIGDSSSRTPAMERGVKDEQQGSTGRTTARTQRGEDRRLGRGTAGLPRRGQSHHAEGLS
ncbi:WhiB family transcriptional regulator [Streptomyces sp. NPDC050704]|uniref:WhiB family transcriptional regulator n=1 Tax=Streptomyces sp. NPDC050704 TaxID=3157219 RepID=UPI00341F19DA